MVTVKSDISNPRVYVNPQETTDNIGGTFMVDIKIEDARDLYSYEFKLSWTGSILEASNVTEADFPSQGGVYTTLFFDNIYNGNGPQGEDYIYVVSTLYAKPIGEDGGGTLATVAFTIESAGETVLDLYDVVVVDSQGTNRPAVWEDAYFSVAPPRFSVDPLNILDPTIVAGNTFSVNITLSNATDVYGFRFRLGYSETLLNATQVSIYSFLDNAQNQTIINNEQGYLWVYSNSSTSQTVDDPRPVANITFKVKEEGFSSLNIRDTFLNDTLSRVSHNPPFEHTPPGEDGYFSNIAAGHDIAVSRVKAVPDEVTAGEQVAIRVTVKNLGGFTETFNVTLYYDGNTIEDRTGVTLESATADTLEFNWDTTDVPAGTYTIKAEASIVEGEENTNDNVGTYSVTIQKSEPGIQPEILYILGGIAIIVIVGLVYFVRFRKP